MASTLDYTSGTMYNVHRASTLYDYLEHKMHSSCYSTRHTLYECLSFCYRVPVPNPRTTYHVPRTHGISSLDPDGNRWPTHSHMQKIDTSSSKRACINRQSSAAVWA